MDMVNWSDLDIEILNIIVERLYYIDQIRRRRRTVCKNWRSNIFKDVKHADKMPWIMSYRANICFDGISSSLFYLHEPSRKPRYPLETKVLYNADVLASKFGWMLLRKKTRLFSKWDSFFFYCPFNNEIIRLPEFYHIKRAHATFSTAPTSSDCVIFAVYAPRASGKFCVGTCSPGDTTWSIVWFEGNWCDGDWGRWMEKVVYSKGVFYCSVHAPRPPCYMMRAYDPELQQWQIHQYPPSLDGPYINCSEIYLIESPDDGNLIVLRFKRQSADCIFKFDPSQKNWFRIGIFTSYNERHEAVTEIENLNNRMLFLSSDSTINLPADGEASDLANTIHKLAARRDCMASRSCRRSCTSTGVVQIYDWVDDERAKWCKFWIQPPSDHQRMVDHEDDDSKKYMMRADPDDGKFRSSLVKLDYCCSVASPVIVFLLLFWYFFLGRSVLSMFLLLSVWEFFLFGYLFRTFGFECLSRAG